ncbi:MAG: hypothetical protein Q8868_00360 [Bacteroidota bacterium]|nr:hypothetical protein [Bacteroidota bacterium]
MVRREKIFILTILCMIAFAGRASAQTNSSPYSAFGLGTLESNGIGPLKGMGGTGIALPSDKSINFLNPASYSGLDSLLSIFELGIFGRYTRYSTLHENQSLVNANLKYIVMGFRISRWLATSFGFTPYSSIGYHINTQAPVEGTNLEYKKTFSGEGGVNQVYLGFSVRPFKNLSLGANALYLFGDVTHSETSDVFSYAYRDVTYVSNVNFNYGLNYHFSIKKFEYYAGVIYNPSKKLVTKNETTINIGGLVEDLKGHTYRYGIPSNIGVGIGVRKDFFSAGIDFEREGWSGISFNNPHVSTRNSNRYSIGVEFPSLGPRKGTMKMFFYRIGAEYRESYLLIDDHPIDYRAITLGAGIPLKGALSTINVALELGQNGTLNGGLFRETFCTLHLDMALRDLWFMKKKYL